MDARDCARVHEDAHDDPSSKALDLSAWHRNDSCAVDAQVAGDDDDRERGPACCESWYWRSTMRIHMISRN